MNGFENKPAVHQPMISPYSVGPSPLPTPHSMFSQPGTSPSVLS
jgi:hypothetical protein